MPAVAPEKEPRTEPDAGYFAEELPGGGARFRAKIGGLHCSLCTGTIERALGRQDGVAQVAVSLTHEQALVDYDPARVRPETLVATLRDIGYTIWDPRKTRPYEEEEAALVKEGRRLTGAIGASLVAIALIVNLANPLAYAIPVVVGAFLLGAGYLVLRGQGRGLALGGTAALAALGGAALTANATGAATGAIPFVVGAMALSVVFGLAAHIASMAAQSLRRGILNQHVMLEAGAFAGLAGGAVGLVARYRGFPTAAFFAVAVLVVNYHVFSEWLSLLVKTRSSQAVKALLDLQPDTARVIRDGAESEVALSEVVVGDAVRVRPGERVALDGVVVEGHSAVDQSLVTGEPVPVEVVAGNTVIGGSINTTGTLVVKVSAVGDESFLSQVVRSVEDARALKPGILHLVDRILRIYTPTVLFISVLALVAWLVGSWAVTGAVDVERAVFAALSVLVMGYPCAVGIAAPLSIVRGAGEAADQGIVMRTGEAFQALRQVGTVAFDKTGTLTEGKPKVTDVVPLGDRGEAEVLRIAAAAESASSHPLAVAIVAQAKARGIAFTPASHSEVLPGKGVSARVDGRIVTIGAAQRLGVGSIDVLDQARRLEAEGKSVSVLQTGGKVLGLIALRDEPRADAPEGLKDLDALGVRTVMLTGDNRANAEAVGQMLGMEVHAELLPEDKLAFIRKLAQGRGGVAKVGDGINDAPALAAATVGIAMGSGTDVALEAADAAVLNNKVGDVAALVRLSRRAMRVIGENVTIALGLKAVFLVTTIAGMTGLWIAILADTGATVLVTANALRLLRIKS